jgi:hypothetical protein
MGEGVNPVRDFPTLSQQGMQRKQAPGKLHKREPQT